MGAGRDLFDDVSMADTGARQDFDFYETHAWMTRTLLYWMPQIKGSVVLECCAGRGAICRVLREEGSDRLVSIDIDGRHPDLYRVRDMTRAESWADIDDMIDPDWIITNPPFKQAHAILQHAIAHARVGVAFLLRKTFTEPTEARGPWLAAHPPRRVIGLPRASFRGKGTDSVPADWFIWLRDPDAFLLPPFIIDPEAESR
jgi:hypothetical protein